jgi:hypothetical protein
MCGGSGVYEERHDFASETLSCPGCHAGELPMVRWVIAGGESDMGATAEARPFDLQWARELGQQCKDAGTAFFMKQKGSTVLDRGQPISCLGKGDEPAFWPAELQRQEFPIARAA